MNDSVLRRELLQLLEGTGAHVTFDDPVPDFAGEATRAADPCACHVGELAILRHIVATWPAGHDAGASAS